MSSTRDRMRGGLCEARNDHRDNEAAEPSGAGSQARSASQHQGRQFRECGRPTRVVVLGLSPKMVPTHPKPSTEASEIKFHGWVPGESNSSSMCLWLEEEIRFD